MKTPYRRIINRREFLGRTLTGAAAGLVAGAGDTRAVACHRTRCACRHRLAARAVRRRFLIESLTGGAELRLHHPEPREIVLVHDAPWEGSGSGYHSCSRTGSFTGCTTRRGTWMSPPGKVNTRRPPAVLLLRRKRRRHPLAQTGTGAPRVPGVKEEQHRDGAGKGRAPPTPTPGIRRCSRTRIRTAPADARYKAIVRSDKPHGLLAFGSPDGLHWTPMSDGPVITQGAFDSQNLAFWIRARRIPGLLADLHRRRDDGDGLEARRRARHPHGHLEGLSPLGAPRRPDLRGLAARAPLHQPDQALPPRAAHLIGFPTRYIERGWSDSMRALPELGAPRVARQSQPALRHRASPRACSWPSRDGVKFKRWNEAFLRPGIERRRHMALRPPIHRLAPGRNEVRARGRAQRTVTLRRRELLDGHEQRPAPLHPASGRLRLGERADERRRTGHETASRLRARNSR